MNRTIVAKLLDAQQRQGHLHLQPALDWLDDPEPYGRWIPWTITPTWARSVGLVDFAIAMENAEAMDDGAVALVAEGDPDDSMRPLHVLPVAVDTGGRDGLTNAELVARIGIPA